MKVIDVDDKHNSVRDKPFSKYIDFEGSSPYIGDIQTAIVHHSDGWWIVASDPEHDDKFTDLGPYPTAEIALVTLRIAQD